MFHSIKGAIRDGIKYNVNKIGQFYEFLQEKENTDY